MAPGDGTGADHATGANQAPPAPAREPAPEGKGVGTFAFFGAITSGISILAAIVRSKVTAHAIGPAGLGVFAEAQQIFTLAMTVSTVAAGPALVTRLAKDLRAGRTEDAGRAVGASLMFGTGLGTVSMVVAAAVYPYAVSASARRPLIEIASLGLAALLGTIGQVYGALFIAQARVKQLTLQSTFAAVVGAALHASLVLTIGVPGQFYAALAAALTSGAASIWLAREAGVRIRLQWDGAFARTAMHVGSTSLMASGLSQLALTSVRLTLDRTGGHAQGPLFNGQYQAALTIGSQYFAIVTSGLGSYFFPKYAAAKSPAELERDIWAAAEFVLRVAPPIVFTMLAVRGPLIHLLYSARFDGAVSILGYQLAGDIAKGVSWAYAGPLLYRGHLRGFLLSETIGAVLLAGLSFWCIRMVGLPGAGIGYAAAYFPYMIAAALITAKTQGIRVRAAHLWIGGAGTIAAALSEVLRLKYARVDVMLLGVAFLWAWRGGLFSMTSAAAKRLRARLSQTALP